VGVALDEFDEQLELPAEGFVLVTQRRSNDALYCDLRADPDALASEGIEALHRVGDCVAPRLIADAIFDGHRLGREIDTPDPAVPLPYRRERATVGLPTPAA
jgi:dimethylamine/trimethylamine dehydrogenase